jgi:hypothetical protein
MCTPTAPEIEQMKFFLRKVVFICCFLCAMDGYAEKNFRRILGESIIGQSDTIRKKSKNYSIVGTKKREYFEIGILAGESVVAGIGHYSKPHYFFLVRPNFGVSTKCFFISRLYIGLDLLYCPMGFGYEAFSFDNQISGRWIENKMRYDYISLPFFVGYQTKNRFIMEASISAGPSFLVKSTRQRDMWWIILENEKIATFLIAGNVGLGYRFSQSFNLKLLAGYSRLLNQNRLFSFSGNLGFYFRV